MKDSALQQLAVGDYVIYYSGGGNYGVVPHICVIKKFSAKRIMLQKLFDFGYYDFNAKQTVDKWRISQSIASDYLVTGLPKRVVKIPFLTLQEIWQQSKLQQHAIAPNSSGQDTWLDLMTLFQNEHMNE